MRKDDMARYAKLDLDLLGTYYGDWFQLDALTNNVTSVGCLIGLSKMALDLKMGKGLIQKKIDHEAEKLGIPSDTHKWNLLGVQNRVDDQLESIAQSVGCSDASELLEAIARGDVVVSRDVAA